MTESVRKKSIVELGALPPNPRNLALSGQNGCVGSITIEALERRIGRRRNATRAPTQAPEWPGRLRPPRILNQTRRSITYCARKMVLTMGATFNIRLDSQAGRRGFESRLPLHLFNEIADFTSPVLPRLPRKPHLPFDAAATASPSLSLFFNAFSSFVTASKRLSLSVMVYVSIATPIV